MIVIFTLTATRGHSSGCKFSYFGWCDLYMFCFVFLLYCAFFAWCDLYSRKYLNCNKIYVSR